MRMIAVAAALGVAVALGGCAATDEQTAAQRLAQLPPWEMAQKTLEAASADIAGKGAAGVQPHVAALEQALAAAPSVLLAPQYKGAEQVVLADGPAEAAAVAAALAGGAGRTPAQGNVTVTNNPYPTIALLLGGHYVHAGQPAEALRVLDAGLALPGAAKGAELGASLRLLHAERGVALGLMQRWPHALASYDRGLRLPGLSAPERARLLRGRAVALIELKRLDEAEVALANALRLDPDNALARQEQLYIGALRSGMAPVAARASVTGRPAP